MGVQGQAGAIYVKVVSETGKTLVSVPMCEGIACAGCEKRPEGRFKEDSGRDVDLLSQASGLESQKNPATFRYTFIVMSTPVKPVDWTNVGYFFLPLRRSQRCRYHAVVALSRAQPPQPRLRAPMLSLATPSMAWLRDRFESASITPIVGALQVWHGFGASQSRRPSEFQNSVDAEWKI